MKTEQQNLAEAPAAADEGTEVDRKMSRRDALSIIGKHAAYTAPAVLAILAVTKSDGAHADYSWN